MTENLTKASQLSSKRNNVVFRLILLSFCLYAGVFIFRTSFVIDGERYFSLFDDMMISMKYAKNLAEGYGLVWNAGGERVEGFTNPLWVLYMSLFHLFPIPQSKISLFVQLTGIPLLALNLYFVKKIIDSISGDSKEVFLGAVLLTAFYLPLNSWSLLGTEVGPLTLIMSVSLWLAFQCINRKTFNIWLFILLGISTFIRPDMVVPFIGFMFFLAATDSENRSKNIIVGSIILFICITTQTIFRIWYYNDIFPNTYYLKLTGFPVFYRITRGLYVFLDFIRGMNFFLFLIPFGILFYRRDKIILLLFWIMFLQALYSIYIGGDTWEYFRGSNRFLSIVMPSFFILFSYSLSHICKAIINNTNLSFKTKEYSMKFVYAFLLIASLISFNSTYGPKALKEFLLIKPPMGMDVNDHKPMTEIALLLRKITTPQAKIAVSWAGTIPYFANRFAIDGTGKNDKVISRQNVDMTQYPGFQKFVAFVPGDNKHNFNYTVMKLKPDVLVLFGIFWRTEEAKPYIDNEYYKKVVLQKEKLVGDIYGYHFSFRKDSPHVLWEEIERLK